MCVFLIIFPDVIRVTMSYEKQRKYNERTTRRSHQLITCSLLDTNIQSAISVSDLNGK
jgi:hypothetical protein